MAQATDLPSPFQMLQNPLQILHKIEYLERRASHGSSNRSANPFPSASNPLQTLDKSDDFGASSTSRLGKPNRRILYKSVVKIIILEPRTPHDSGRRSPSIRHFNSSTLPFVKPSTPSTSSTPSNSSTPINPRLEGLKVEGLRA